MVRVLDHLDEHAAPPFTVTVSPAIALSIAVLMASMVQSVEL
jgi:hypothetical protein